MEEADSIWRELILGTGLLALALYLLGGFLSRVAGRWRDNDGAIIELEQMGPWVWGLTKRPEGEQRFRGRVVWGRVRLQRSDFGEKHLQSLGFSREQAVQIKGQVTGFLTMTLGQDILSGHFFGRKFSFQDDKVSATRAKEGIPRTWTRVPGESG